MPHRLQTLLRQVPAPSAHTFTLSLRPYIPGRPHSVFKWAPMRGWVAGASPPAHPFPHQEMSQQQRLPGHGSCVRAAGGMQPPQGAKDLLGKLFSPCC